MPQPLVALQVRNPELADPAEMQAKAYNLRSLALQDQAAQQARADDQAARAAFSSNPTDNNARLSALAGVSPAAYGAEAKRQADLAKSGAETRVKQLEAAHKANDMAGQAFSYVRKFPTLDNAKSAINWLTQNGVYTPEQGAQYLDQVQKNPAAIQSLAEEAFYQAQEVKDHLYKLEKQDLGGTAQTLAFNPVSGETKVTSTTQKTQTPDSVASNERIASEGIKNRANAMEIAKLKNVAGGAEASLNDDTLDLMASQYLRGDKSVLQNLGRGAQGAANLVALRGRITNQAKAAGMSGGDIASVMSDYAGQTAAMRTAGNISARIENAAAEAEQLAPLAIEAGRQVARSGFLPFGRAQVMFNNQTNDPALNKFATANMGLATAYASAMARGNKPTVSDMEHSRELLTTAKSQEAYEAIVSQMQQEIAAAQRAPRSVRENLRGEISGKGGGHGAAPAAAPALPAGWGVTEVK